MPDPRCGRYRRGRTAGGALEKELGAGLPHDELSLYEDALGNGRSVVIAFVKPEGAILPRPKAQWPVPAPRALIEAARELVDRTA